MPSKYQQIKKSSQRNDQSRQVKSTSGMEIKSLKKRADILSPKGEISLSNLNVVYDDLELIRQCLGVGCQRFKMDPQVINKMIS
mmetsp:Transcript_13571/g.13315  ORF Transcript_13571/g.13315 Transcript_13571/m.13315 type:complete len:84 (+) Transcript_13571:158-409(+)